MAWSRTASVAVVAESTLPSIAALRLGEPVGDEDIQRDVDDFVQLLEAGCERHGCVVAADWVRPPLDRGLGPIDMGSGGWGHAYAVQA